LDDNEFLIELGQIVARRASSMHLVDTLAFVTEVAERLEEDPVFGEFIDVEYSGSGSHRRTLRLHGYTELDEADGNIGLVVGKWSDLSEPETLSSSDVKELSGWMENFIAEAIDSKLDERITESNKAYELATLLRYGKGKINRIRLHILTNRTLSQRFKEEKAGEIGGIPVERHIWDLQRLKAIYQSSREREAVQIDIQEFGVSGIPFLEAASTESIKSFLCVVNGNLLADMFERYGSRLLEGNVRSFLGMKGGVNKGIRATIQDSPELFFAYNNGIAATASDVLFGGSGSARLITGLVDLQIVNGGQTTASVLNARKNYGYSLDGVTVQMKLSCVGEAQSHDLIPRIAEYANTQNKVAIADFFANHPFHRKMEEISRRLPTPAKAGQRIQSKWFYERSRGQYQNERLYLSKAKKDLFDTEYPSKQVINKTELAKYDSTWICRPYWTSLGPQKNFTKFAGQFSSKDPDITETEYWKSISPNFGDAYYQRIAALALLWKRVEDIVHAGRGSWYMGDYRPQIVAYTLSTLFYAARKSGFQVDLPGIWNKQDVSPSLDSYLIKLAMVIQDALLEPQEGKGRVDEWCKREACWESIKDVRIPSIDSIQNDLISIEEFSREKVSSRKQGIQDDGIAIQKEVLGLTQAGYWAALLKWQNAPSVLNPVDRALVVRASTLPGFLKVTLEKDWKRLLQLRSLAEDEGFRHR